MSEFKCESNYTTLNNLVLNMTEVDKIHFIHFDIIDSTNTWVKNNAQHLDHEKISCITALEQTAGHGRFSRKWLSPKGENIYASLFFCIPANASYLINLSQLMSLSCAKMLKKFGFDAKIKWPNDLMIKGQKIAGILTETVQFDDKIGVVLGIGLNVDISEEILSTIDQPATSLAQLCEQTYSTEQLLKPLLEIFLADVSLLKEKGFGFFKTQYESLLLMIGEETRYYDGKNHYTGICSGITDTGKLKLLLPNQQWHLLSSGETSLKK